ncbi:MAG: Gfo/Idh/MocA family oxidoreductase [Bacteroidota bacterium]|nr:Gfo/Idh/MocA family oxidoreductase [Bacteroidota bacterium]
MEKLNIGVIGVGHLGALHTKMFTTIESANVVGVYDQNFERSKKIADEFQTKSFEEIDELLNSVDAVSIAVSTKSHFDIAAKALTAGKHIFIEKPITENSQQAEKLIQIAKPKKLKIQVGHIERFNSALLAIDHIQINPLFIESHRLAQFNPRGADVAVVHDLMIHDIDIILSLVKSPVENIWANGVAVVTDTIDIANARLQFQNGCVANVTASRISKSRMRKMRFFQKDAYISLDFIEGTSEVFRLVDPSDANVQSTMMLGMIEAANSSKKIIYDRPARKEINALKYELELFIDAVQNDKTPQVTAEDGLRALEVAQTIVEKISNQQPFFKLTD